MPKIVSKISIGSSVKQMEIYAPEIANKALAGQFVIVKIDEFGERIPLTIADAQPNKGTIEIVFLEVGATTKRLGELQVGDEIQDLLGPLGVPSEMGKFGKVICVGGGVGTAPLYMLAKAYKAHGNKVTTIIGARTKELLIFEDRLRNVSDELYVTTDDGSYARKGFVTTVLKEILDDSKSSKPELVMAIGPVVMMKAVSELTKNYGVRTLVSLNPIMVDGTGMCGACRVSVGGETKFACVHGPDFDGHKVDFKELMSRLSQYTDKEKISLDRYEEMRIRKGGSEKVEREMHKGGCCCQ